MTTADAGASAASGTSADSVANGTTSSAIEAAAAAWRRTVLIWHLAFYGMMAVMLVVIATGTMVAGERWVSIAAALGIVVAYTVVGRPAAERRDPRHGVAYLLVLIPSTLLVVGAHPLGSILMFVAYSQIWFFSERRRTGVVLTVVLSAGAWVGFAFRVEGDRAALVSLAGQMTLSLTFSLLLGLWISQVVDQSQERAELLARLEEAQAELGRSHHAAGVTAERERLAREIHDTLAQGFTSVVMLAQTAAADLGRGDHERTATRLGLIERTARENLAEARALVAAFAPVDLQDGSLTGALARLAERFERETGVQVALVLPDVAPVLARESEVVLLRAAQEALSNVRRHARASQVRLLLQEDGDGHEVALEVVDDGHGFDPQASVGLGLAGMRERVASGGGLMDVQSSQAGTRLRVTLPVGSAS